MAKLRNEKTLTVSIDCPPERLYRFVSDPRNMPRWTTSFVRSARKEGKDWVLDTTDGPTGIRFVEQNDFGVLDHHVVLPSGAEVLNPMRVVPNGPGSELMFTLFQLPEMSSRKFAEDAGMVERDLRTLKSVLEQLGRSPPPVE